jgi:hypothetical protein
MRVEALLAISLLLGCSGSGSHAGARNSGSNDSGSSNGDDAGSPSEGDAGDDSGDGDAAAASNPGQTPTAGGSGSWTGTQLCTALAGLNVIPPQKTNVILSAAQVTAASTTVTLTGITIGPVAGWSCPGQTIVAPAWNQYGIEWFGAGADGGASVFTPCAMPSGTPLGPTVMYVLGGKLVTNIKPAAIQFLVEVTPGTIGADGGIDQTGNDAGIYGIQCTFALTK